MDDHTDEITDTGVRAHGRRFDSREEAKVYLAEVDRAREYVAETEPRLGERAAELLARRIARAMLALGGPLAEVADDEDAG